MITRATGTSLKLILIRTSVRPRKEESYQKIKEKNTFFSYKKIDFYHHCRHKPERHAHLLFIDLFKNHLEIHLYEPETMLLSGLHR